MRYPETIPSHHREDRIPSGIDGCPLGLDPFDAGPHDEDAAFTPLMLTLGAVLFGMLALGVGSLGYVVVVVARQAVQVLR